MKRDYFRNYSNFCILDFLLILTLKYINYIFNTKRHSDTFKHVANFFDIFTDPQLRDRHKTIDTTSFDRFRKLCASNRGGTREARRDFSPYFFFFISIALSKWTPIALRPPVILRSFTCYQPTTSFTGRRFFSPGDKLPQAEWPPRVNKPI